MCFRTHRLRRLSSAEKIPSLLGHSMERLDTICCFGLHLRKNMGVDVEDEGAGRMTQLFRNHLRRRTGRER